MIMSLLIDYYVVFEIFNFESSHACILCIFISMAFGLMSESFKTLPYIIWEHIWEKGPIGN